MMSLILSVALSCGACSSNGSGQATVTAPVKTAVKDTVKYTTAMVDNRRDPSCGMPLSAGIGDTVHYKGKVLGFCSRECKQDFMKDPEKNIAAADMKK